MLAPAVFIATKQISVTKTLFNRLLPLLIQLMILAFDSWTSHQQLQ